MWEPWRGPRYDDRRLLLLGESAYSWMEEGELVDPSPRHSVELVEDAIARFPTNPFMDKLTRGLAGEERPSDPKRRACWESVAFTNYVPGTVGTGARLRPSDLQWDAARAAFPSLISRLRPRRIIVLGKTLWSRMPETSVVWSEDAQAYRMDGELISCLAVRHPSAGLSWRALAAIVHFAHPEFADL